MHNLFFELLQISVGSREGLSFVPTERDWNESFEMAKRQALLGICFYGLQKVCRNDAAKAENLPKGLKLQWLSIAANIQKRNELMNSRCAELYRMIKTSGYESCVLKGQAVARLYERECHDDSLGNLSLFRQSGDIDMWMVADVDSVLKWAERTQTMYYYDYHHADLRLFEDVDIELHYRPSISRNLLRNCRLQKWFRTEGRKHIEYDEGIGFCVPDATFSLVLTLNHNLWHLLYEGVGLRQMMDLYFVAKSMGKSAEIDDLLRRFGLSRFAAASAWVLWYLFDCCSGNSFFVSEDSPLPQPDEKGGRFLLGEIMKAGNFGHYDSRLSVDKSGSRIVLMAKWMKHTFRLVKYYPVDVLWTPLGILWISLWRRLRK